MTIPTNSASLRTERHTDHVVRYENGLACLTSDSLVDAETVARLLRESGVADVRVFCRVTETRETEVGVPLFVPDGPDKERMFNQLKTMKGYGHSDGKTLVRAMTKEKAESAGIPTGEEACKANIPAINALFGAVKHTATTGCREWMEARVSAPEFPPPIWCMGLLDGGFTVGRYPAPIKFCPWCGEGVK